MTDSSNKKSNLHSTQLYTPLAPHQVHTRKPYYDEVESYKLPSNDTNHWKCWTPAPQVQFLRSAKAVPCPPRITYSGVFQQRKAEQDPTPSALVRREQNARSLRVCQSSREYDITIVVFNSETSDHCVTQCRPHNERVLCMKVRSRIGLYTFCNLFRSTVLI